MVVDKPSPVTGAYLFTRMQKTKVRAWDKRFDELVDVDVLVWAHEKLVEVKYASSVDWNHDDGGIWKAQPADVVLMQFTGLKDKNGEHVYEGDILKANNGNWQIKFGEWKLWNGIKLLPMSGFFAERDDEEGRKHQLPLITAEIEVIGNVYENPELLK